MNVAVEERCIAYGSYAKVLVIGNRGGEYEELIYIPHPDSKNDFDTIEVVSKELADALIGTRVGDSIRHTSSNGTISTYKILRID